MMEAAIPAPGAAPDGALRELRHRNDNALQLVASLLRLRLARLPLAAAAALAPAVGQIEALVLAQAHLNRHRGGRIGLRRPLEELCGAQTARGARTAGEVRVLLDAHEVEVEPDRLVPLILFTQEAIGNAQRHAFGPGAAGGGTVRVRLRPTGTAGTDGLVLEIADDGAGLPPGSTFLRAGRRDAGRRGAGRRGGGRRGTGRGGGLGGQLIEGFVRQLGGEVTLTSGPGVTLTLTIV